MNTVQSERNLTTADLVAASKTSGAPRGDDTMVAEEMAGQPQEVLAELFAPEIAQEFRSRWDAVQIGFVDDPRESVQRADELVAQVMASLAETFASERSQLEGYLGNEQDASTENLRVALQRYRSFFQRLLSL